MADEIKGITLDAEDYVQVHVEGNRIGARIVVDGNTALLVRDNVRALRDYLTSLLGDEKKHADLLAASIINAHKRERAAVVAFLREQEGAMNLVYSPAGLASEIEKGAHMGEDDS